MKPKAWSHEEMPFLSIAFTRLTTDFPFSSIGLLRYVTRTSGRHERLSHGASLSYCMPRWRSGAIQNSGGLVLLRSCKEDFKVRVNTQSNGKKGDRGHPLCTRNPFYRETKGRNCRHPHPSKLFPSLFPKRYGRYYIMRPSWSQRRLSTRTLWV